MKPVICIKEPRGDHGLEGYQMNETYQAEGPLFNKLGREYMRVYQAPDYYETCTMGVFREHFQEVTK